MLESAGVCLLENWREIDSRCLHVAKIWREIKNEVAQQKAMHLQHDHDVNVSKRTTATATTPLIPLFNPDDNTLEVNRGQWI